MLASPKRNAVRWLAFALALAFGVLCLPRARADEPHEPAVKDEYAADLQGFVPGASRLEGRLMAPCCWTQTIDIHDSEVAISMRHELRRRLRNGESPDAIEASFVQRYGPKILAVPPGSPLKTVAVGLSLLMGAAGVAAAMMLGRWRKHREALPATASPVTKRDQWDDRLDAELKSLDDA
jgi:cytochrome c-type biogenesis protein CcmH